MKIKNAQILAMHLSLGTQQLHGLGENDRSSTGFLPPVGTARPSESVLGWEPAVRAQKRITNVVDSIIRTDRTAGAIAIVSHGAVGTLLFCRLCGCGISRKWDHPACGSSAVVFSIKTFSLSIDLSFLHGYKISMRNDHL